MRIVLSNGSEIAIENGDFDGILFTGFYDSKGVEIFVGCELNIWLEDSVEPEGGFWSHTEVHFYQGCLVCKQIGFDYTGQEDQIQMLFEVVEEYKCEVVSL